VIAHTAVVSETEKCSIKDGSAIDTMLLPMVPIIVPINNAASIAQGEYVFG